MKFTLLILIAIFVSCSQRIEQEQNTVQSQQKLEIIIPKRQEPISLETFVDWGAKEGKLSNLRDVALPNGDFEIRFWISQGVGSRVGTSGLIIEKSGENLSALNVDRMFYKEVLNDENSDFKNHFVTPKSDWQSVLKKLSEAEIFTLPDSSELKTYKGNGLEDGFGYIVEINKDKIYRIYEYGNPDFAENPEAKQIVKIGDIIADEFGLEEFRAESN